MVWSLVKIWLFFLLFVGGVACGEIEKPRSLTPEVLVLEAFDITRNSAGLCCGIKIVGTETVSSVTCHYGTSTDMDHRLDCEVSGSVLVSLVDLAPNTTYYYCFEVSNGYGKVRSDVCQFTTDPKEAPQIGELKMLGKGPVSVIVQFELMDNGGEDLDAAGFYVREKGGEEKQVVVDRGKEPFLVRLGDLKPLTYYEIQGFAKNEIGETRTENLEVYTESVVSVVTAGTLREVIGAESLYAFQELTVSGPLNGSDFRTLREMMGCAVEGTSTAGRLSRLDLTDASIESGGDSYDGSHYTNPDVLGVGMFADCLFLEEIRLPYGVIEIEKNAFEGCAELKRFNIPASTAKVASSAGCINLATIHVDVTNENYTSHDGSLYNADLTTLYWWPEGKRQIQEHFPEQLKRIENYACQYMQLAEFPLPSSVSELGIGSFYASGLETFTVPAKVVNIPTALFQECHRLKTVWLGKEVGTLSAYSFDGCPWSICMFQSRIFYHSVTRRLLQHKFIKIVCCMYLLAPGNCIATRSVGGILCKSRKISWISSRSIIGLFLPVSFPIAINRQKRFFDQVSESSCPTLLLSVA